MLNVIYELFSKYVPSLIGVLIGGLITYFVQTQLMKKQRIKFHQLNLRQLQIVMINMINELKNLQSNYNQYKKHDERHLIPPIILTDTAWRLDKDSILSISLDNSRSESELIYNLSLLDKEYMGLIGSIDDKIRYYEKYDIDTLKMQDKKIPEKIKKHMKTLTDIIYERLEKIDLNLDLSFQALKSYMDFKYSNLSINYEQIKK